MDRDLFLMGEQEAMAANDAAPCKFPETQLAEVHFVSGISVPMVAKQAGNQQSDGPLGAAMMALCVGGAARSADALGRSSDRRLTRSTLPSFNWRFD